jgi:hypothetical protein
MFSVNDHGFFLTLQSIRRHLAAMPNDLYLVRLIHAVTRKVCPGERLWSATLLTRVATVGFLRARNREGYDVYIVPYADRQNSGYIFLDLDRPGPNLLSSMHAKGHEPCLVLQSSSDHLQAWVRLSDQPLPPLLATAISKHLARLYQADLASTDWCHLGRLAGFTNQKPSRRTRSGHAPWVRVLLSQPRIATQAAPLVATLRRALPDTAPSLSSCSITVDPPDPSLTPSLAIAIYQSWLDWLSIPQRFPQPDWSIADKWIAKELLRCGTPVAQIHAVLRFGSPQFPRRHSDPDDYLRRTLSRAISELHQQAPLGCRADSLMSRPDPTRPAFSPSAQRQRCVAGQESAPSPMPPHTATTHTADGQRKTSHDCSCCEASLSSNSAGGKYPSAE